MRPLDLAILALYLVGVTVFGCSFYFRKSAKGAAGFVAGGGKVPSWAIGLSIFATLVSSISFLALPAKAFATNWNALVFSFAVRLTTCVYSMLGGVLAVIWTDAIQSIVLGTTVLFVSGLGLSLLARRSRR